VVLGVLLELYHLDSSSHLALLSGPTFQEHHLYHHTRPFLWNLEIISIIDVLMYVSTATVEVCVLQKKMFSDQGRVRDKLWFLVMVCNLDSIQRKSQIKHYHERSCSILSFRRHPLGNLIRGPGNNNLFLVLWMFREGGCCVRLVVDKVWSLPRSPVSPFSPLVPDPEHAEEQVPDSPFSPRIESPGVPGAPGMPSLPCKTPILTAMLSDTNCNAIWY